MFVKHNRVNYRTLNKSKHYFSKIETGLAQSVERLTAEREVAGSIPGTGPILRVLKLPRNEGTLFALQEARPSLGWAGHVKWWSRIQFET